MVKFKYTLGQDVWAVAEVRPFLRRGFIQEQSFSITSDGEAIMYVK